MCTTRMARRVIIGIIVFALVYNVPHWFEVAVVPCYDSRNNISAVKVRVQGECIAEKRVQVMPTEFRLMPLYVKIYYTWLYAILMAIGPLGLLIVSLLVACHKRVTPPRRFSIR